MQHEINEKCSKIQKLKDVLQEFNILKSNFGDATAPFWEAFLPLVAICSPIEASISHELPSVTRIGVAAQPTPTNVLGIKC